MYFPHVRVNIFYAYRCVSDNCLFYFGHQNFFPKGYIITSIEQKVKEILI